MSATAPQPLSWLTEMIVRKTTSTVSASQEKCVDNCPPLLLRKVHRSKGLVPRNSGCQLFTEVGHHLFRNIVPFSARLVCIWPAPFLFWSRSEEWPVSVRESFCILCNTHGICNAHFCVSVASPYNVIVMKMIRPVNCSGSHRISPIIFWISARICNVVHPGWVCHSNSIGSPSTRSNSRYWRLTVVHSIFSCHASVALVYSYILPRQNTESENTKALAVDSWIALSLKKDVLCHECECQSIFDTPWISVLICDQLLWHVEQLLYRSLCLIFGRVQILHVIYPKVNCSDYSSKHKQSPYQRFRIEVVHTVSWFATNFHPQVWVDLLKMWDGCGRYLIIVWPLWVDVDDVWTFGRRFPRACWKIQVLVCFRGWQVSSHEGSVLHQIATLENSTLRHFDLNLQLQFPLRSPSPTSTCC